MTSATRKILACGLALLALGLFMRGVLGVRMEPPELLRRGGERARPAPSAAGHAVPAATANPAAIATEALRACADKGGTEKTACYKETLVSLVPTSGVETAMESLRRIGAADRDVERDGHVYAHAIGIAAYRSGGEVVETTFARCSEIYQSGCYHGVIQAYFEGVRAPGPEAVNALCRPYAGAGASRWLLFQCVHGMGHGLTMLYDHDLPRALESCDLLTDDWERHSCYGGAFMENIVHATAPHHSAGTEAGGGGAGQAEHAGGGALHHRDASDGAETGGMESTRARFKALDARDPHYPCSILDERYLVDCYQMQTSAILFHNGGEIAAAARTCDGAPPAMRSVCYQSLGRDISSRTLQDHAESIRLCSQGNPEYQPWCYVGLVKNFVDLTAKTEEGFLFCRSVPGRTNKMKCYEALGEEITVLENAAGDREALCERSERDYLEACRYGARLTPERPPGLPVLVGAS